MKKLFAKFKNALLETVTPTSRCMLCGTDVFDDGGFCENCMSQVVFNNGKTCLRCGVAIHGEEDYCGHCASEKIYFDRAYSPFSYCGGVQKAILDMKFHNLAANAKVLSHYLADCSRQNNLTFDLVTFVPMTKKAQKKRGYNQAQLLAEYFCATMCIDEPKRLLVKVKNTLPQEKLGSVERRENLSAAFAATESLNGKTVLLIDDIKTTGTTLNECAKALKKKGAEKVLCLTVASREEKIQTEQDVLTVNL